METATGNFGSGVPATAFPLLAPDGAVGAPSYAFSSSTGTGMWQFSGNLGFSAAGIRQLAIGSGAVFVDIGVLNIRDIVNGTFVSLNVPTAVADTLEQRRNINAQTFNLYNTYTNSGNYERMALSWAANVATISPQALGTGVLRSLLIGATSAQVIGFMGATGQAQKTGFGTPTGTGVVTNFPGATATLAQTSQAVAQLILDLKALGLYGA